MSDQDIISGARLKQKLEGDISENKFKDAAQFLIDAINDWPTLNLSEPEEFLIELTNEIGKPLTLENVKNYLNALNNKDDSWKREALSSLLEVFDYDKTKMLDKIIADITEHYK